MHYNSKEKRLKKSMPGKEMEEKNGIYFQEVNLSERKQRTSENQSSQMENQGWCITSKYPSLPLNSQISYAKLDLPKKFMDRIRPRRDEWMVKEILT